MGTTQDQYKIFLLSLEKEIEEYLFEDFLPYMGDCIVDKEWGGFLWNTNREGKNISTTKRTWYDGRGVWVYAMLYEHFGKKKEYLQVAEKTIGLLQRIKPDTLQFWPDSYTREGVPISELPGDIYGGLFVAEGWIAYAKAVEDGKYLELAKQTLLEAVERYDRNDYHYAPHYDSGSLNIQAPRVLGHWMALLNISTQLLQQEDDSRIQQINDRCIQALFDAHLQPDSRVMIEYLDHDFSVPTGHFSQFSYMGHAIETMWMVMVEAERRKDLLLFDKAAKLFKRHVEIAWDDVYGGVFHCLRNIEKNDWLLEKVLWAQEEVMNGLLILIASQDDEWAKRWLPRVWNYLKGNFVLQDHPRKLWINGGDRQLKKHHQIERLENYHHPRFLMLSLLKIEEYLSSAH